MLMEPESESHNHLVTPAFGTGTLSQPQWHTPWEFSFFLNFCGWGKRCFGMDFLVDGLPW